MRRTNELRLKDRILDAEREAEKRREEMPGKRCLDVHHAHSTPLELFCQHILTQATKAPEGSGMPADG